VQPLLISEKGISTTYFLGREEKEKTSRKILGTFFFFYERSLALLTEGERRDDEQLTVKKSSSSRGEGEPSPTLERGRGKKVTSIPCRAFSPRGGGKGLSPRREGEKRRRKSSSLGSSLTFEGRRRYSLFQKGRRRGLL